MKESMRPCAFQQVYARIRAVQRGLTDVGAPRELAVCRRKGIVGHAWSAERVIGAEWSVRRLNR